MTGFHLVIQSSIKWDFLWQGHQIRALRLARDVPVTFIETTGLRAPGPRKALERLRRALVGRSPEPVVEQPAPLPEALRIVSPLVLPPTRFSYRLLNRRLFLPRLARRVALQARRPLVYVSYLPTRSALDLGDLLRPDLTVYHCLLDFPNFPGIPADIAESEAELARHADLVIVDSDHSRSRLSALSKRIYEISPGVDFEHFASAGTGVRRAGDASSPARALYYGGMADHRFDWGLVQGLAEEGIEVDLYGPAEHHRPGLHPNITLHGAVPYADLPALLATADVLILPYLVNDFNRATFPVKLFQAFAAGIPVVATPLPELMAYADVIDVRETPGSFVAAACSAAARDTPERRAARVEAARRHSWSSKTEEMLALIREGLHS